MTGRLTRRELLRLSAGAAALAAAGTTGALAVAHDLDSGLGLSAERAQAAAAPSALGRWTTRAPLPFPRTEVSVAALGGRMYLLGGYAHGRVDQPFNQEYDPASDRWRDLYCGDRWQAIRPLPAKRGAMSVVELQGKSWPLCEPPATAPGPPSSALRSTSPAED